MSRKGFVQLEGPGEKNEHCTKNTLAHQNMPFAIGLYGAYNTIAGAYNMYSRAKEVGNQISSVQKWLGVGDENVHLGEEHPTVLDQSSFFKNSAAWSLSSMVMYYTGKYAFSYFVQEHGPLASTQLAHMVQSGWNGVGNKMNTKELQSKVQASADSMHDVGASSVGSIILSTFPEKTQSLLLLVVGTLAVFTHSLGALEMQNQVQKAAKDKIWNVDDDSFWDEINPTTNSSSARPKKGNLSDEGPLKKLYSENEFYKSGKGIRYFQFSTDVHLVRVIFNIILGASIQFNTFLGSGGSDGSDSILQFSRWANMVMYWEILVHLLRLHGWGPLYVALKHMSRILASNHNKPALKGRFESVPRRGGFAIKGPKIKQ